MILFKDEAANGCYDNCGESKRDHANRVLILAEGMVGSYRQIAGADAVTPYMHVMLAHVYDMILRRGSLTKYSSQGVEAIHQPIKKDALLSNRKDTVKTVLAKSSLRSEAQDARVVHRRKDKENKAGGHQSKKDRELHDHALANVRAKHHGKPYLRD